MEKNIHGIGVFLDSNLNFTIRVFIWGLANDLDIWKKMKTLQKRIILSNFDLRNNTISNLSGQSQCKSIANRLTTLKFQSPKKVWFTMKIYRKKNFRESFFYRCAKC